MSSASIHVSPWDANENTFGERGMDGWQTLPCSTSCLVLFPLDPCSYYALALTRSLNRLVFKFSSCVLHWYSTWSQICRLSSISVFETVRCEQLKGANRPPGPVMSRALLEVEFAPWQCASLTYTNRMYSGMLPSAIRSQHTRISCRIHRFTFSMGRKKTTFAFERCLPHVAVCISCTATFVPT